jgi:3-dehydroquinate dehydratase-2
MKSVLLLNGPNLAVLGRREPELYGHKTLRQIEAACQQLGQRHGIEIAARQSNHEGELIDWLNGALGHVQGIIINPGGLTHTSVSLRDALAMMQVPIIEVHLTDIANREPFRQISLISDIATEVIKGMGAQGYELAVEKMAQLITRKTA